MWLFTKYGFFSTVCARQDDGKHGRDVDPTRIMVRARVRKHLEELQKRFAELIGGCKVCEFTGSDYAYRIFVDKPGPYRQAEAGMLEAAVSSNQSIPEADYRDYPNFESVMERDNCSILYWEI